MSARIAIALCAIAVAVPAYADDPPPAPPPPPPPQAPPRPPTFAPPPKNEDMKMRLNRQAEGFDDAVYKPVIDNKIGRASGFFVGASVAYASAAKIEVATTTMDGTVEFPMVFAAELQAGYRVLPFLSVALAPEMLFNMQPNAEAAAHELGIFVQATGHLALSDRWDFDLFAAPGYSMVLIPDARDARGLAFRVGGGPMYHLDKGLSVVAEFSRQIGFQQTERSGRDVDMRTSFYAVLAGVRLRR
jgi:hypothetical protein